MIPRRDTKLIQTRLSTAKATNVENLATIASIMDAQLREENNDITKKYESLETTRSKQKSYIVQQHNNIMDLHAYVEDLERHLNRYQNSLQRQIAKTNHYKNLYTSVIGGETTEDDESPHDGLPNMEQ